MNKRIMQNSFRSVFKRFLRSFLLVLVLPIVFFSFLFVESFYKTYQEKIIEQRQNSLDVLKLDLERELENLWTVAFYNCYLTYMQDYNIEKEYRYDEVKEMLRSEEAKQFLLERVYYYTDSTPQKVYSSTGTLPWDYFANVYLGSENPEQLLQMLEDGDALGLGVWKQSIGKDGGYKERLYYNVSISPGKIWFFRLSVTDFSQILTKNSENIILLDEEGTQLFPFIKLTAAVENSKEYYEINSKSEISSFQLVEFIEKDILFDELDDLKNSFLATIIVLILLGSVLSFVLTSYHERPLSELHDYFTQKVKDIPDNIKDYDVLKYAIDAMENKILLGQNQRVRNNLLIQLCLGWNDSIDSLNKKMAENGLFQNLDRYCVFVVSMYEKLYSYRNKVEMYLQTKIDAEYEFYRLELEIENQQIFIVGMSEVSAKRLEHELLKMIDFFQDDMNIQLFIYMGKMCSKWQEIHSSYMGVTTKAKVCDSTRKEKIIYCEAYDEEVDVYFYPDVELNKLYSVLKEADIDGIDIMTDIFVEILKKYSSNRFFYKSILFDVINTYDKATKKLYLNMDSVLSEIECLKNEDDVDAIKIIQYLSKQFKNCIESKQNKSGDNFIDAVTKYIDENKQCSELNVSMVADYFEVSISNLSHQFKLYKNQKILDYITERRFEYAGELLKNTDYRVVDISAMLGYTQTSNFIRKFKQHYGVTPAEYRNNEKDKLLSNKDLEDT